MNMEIDFSDPLNLEKKYVHDIYNTIHKDFDTTRINHWKAIKDFIANIGEDKVIGDIGCGNGKNMLLRPKQFEGCDICPKFVEICQSKKLVVKRGDILALPFDNNHFDHIICVAVIHHLSTDERRQTAVKEITRCLKKNGTALIVVWAIDVKEEVNKKKQYDKQDVLIPWLDTITGKSELRYYHLFKEGELEKICQVAGGIEIISSNYEKGNWMCTIKKVE